MKQLKATLGPAVAIICLLVIVANFSGCSKDFFPRAAKDDLVTEELAKPNTPKFLSYGKVLPSLKKTITVTKYVDEDGGGVLQLQYKIDTETGQVKVRIKLKIHRDSIEDDAEICMTVDDETFLADLDVLFGPSGLDFERPADLDVDIDNIDLTGVDPSNVNLYYENKETGEWEIMNCKKVQVDVENGTIKVQKGELPHFSRYALCKG
jgi:hypothetical protein